MPKPQFTIGKLAVAVAVLCGLLAVFRAANEPTMVLGIGWFVMCLPTVLVLVGRWLGLGGRKLANAASVLCGLSPYFLVAYMVLFVTVLRESSGEVAAIVVMTVVLLAWLVQIVLLSIATR